MDKIKVLLVKTGEPSPEIVEIENTLSEMQRLVGGWIEVVQLDDNVYLTCNEEGKINGKSFPNRHIKLSHFDDIIYGDFFITAIDQEGESVSLTDEQIAYWKDFFRLPTGKIV